MAYVKMTNGILTADIYDSPEAIERAKSHGYVMVEKLETKDTENASETKGTEEVETRIHRKRKGL